MRQKGFVPIIIILIVLIGVGGSFYLGTRVNKTSFTTGTISSPIPSSVPEIESTISVDPVTGQKLYTNISQGFSFEYPNNFYISNLIPPHDPQTFISGDNEDALNRRFMTITSNYLQHLGNNQSQKDFAMELIKLKIGESYTYESALNYFETATRLPDQNIGGFKALVFEIPKPWEMDGPYRKIFVPQGSDYLLIDYTNSNFKGHSIDYLEGFGQILSTFTFTQ